MRNSLHYKIGRIKTLPDAAGPRPLRWHRLYNIVLTQLIAVVCLTVFYQSLEPHVPNARVKVTQNDIEVAIPLALDMFEIENGDYPLTEQGLQALIQKPTTGTGSGTTWNGPYLKIRQIPTDPWGNEYIYISPGRYNPDSFDLSSLGPDGVPSADDIVNWEDTGSTGPGAAAPNKDVFFPVLLLTISIMIVLECFINERGWDKPFPPNPCIFRALGRWGIILIVIAWIGTALLYPAHALLPLALLFGPVNLFLRLPPEFRVEEVLLVVSIITINTAYILSYPLTRSPRGLILSCVGVMAWIFFGFAAQTYFG